jgi:hypothetical protein
MENLVVEAPKDGTITQTMENENTITKETKNPFMSKASVKSTLINERKGITTASMFVVHVLSCSFRK